MRGNISKLKTTLLGPKNKKFVKWQTRITCQHVLEAPQTPPPQQHLIRLVVWTFFYIFGLKRGDTNVPGPEWCVENSSRHDFRVILSIDIRKLKMYQIFSFRTHAFFPKRHPMLFFHWMCVNIKILE